MFTDATRRFVDHAIIGQMAKKRRLPPGTPAIGAVLVSDESSGGEFGVGIIAQGGGGDLLCHDLSFAEKDGL